MALLEFWFNSGEFVHDCFFCGFSIYLMDDDVTWVGYTWVVVVILCLRFIVWCVVGWRA